MPNRVYNFNPGPSTLPLSVLEKAQSELIDYDNNGMSVMELSHRSKEFEAIVHETEANFKDLAGLSDDYRVLFIQGGASFQFDMIPMNFIGEGKRANYVVTGNFAERAYQEALKIGQTTLAATTEEDKHNRIPSQEELEISADAAYVHITTNNTVYGTQWQYTPETGDVPLIADMSSDILSRPMDFSKYSLIYAGAQKNLGPSGVTVVVIHKDLLSQIPAHLPSMLRYDIFAKNDSLYNTPPTFGIYMVNLILKWIKEQGGLAAMAKYNEEKAKLIYDAIDASNGFYKGYAQADCRSLMNITYNLPNSDLEAAFVKEAAAKGLIGLKGYRSVGGIRASVYNAMTKEGCEALAAFMDDFRNKNA